MTSSTPMSTPATTASHVLSVLAFGAIVASALIGHPKDGLTGGGDDSGNGGLGIPGLGNSTPQSCTLTSSDPRNKNSCNSEGGNGDSGQNGSVHGNAGHYEDYHNDPGYQDYVKHHRAG
jgi:hypothetical protein